MLFSQTFVQKKLDCQKTEVKTIRVRQRGFYYCSELQCEFQRLGWTPEICCGLITEWAVRSSLFSAPKAELMAMRCSCFPRMKRRYGIGKEVETIWRFPPIVQGTWGVPILYSEHSHSCEELSDSFQPSYPAPRYENIFNPSMSVVGKIYLCL